MLAALAGQDPRVKPVASPRHADLLIVVEPVTPKLAPAVAEVARAMPRPARALLLGEPALDEYRGTHLVRVEEILPEARRVAQASVEQIVALALDPARWPALTIAEVSTPEPTTIPLPPKREREIATELAVLSLGPIQPWTAGPLRLLLVCDGEQVLSAQSEAGYARRGISAAMMEAGWREAADLARRLDPLAPVAGQLVYVLAMEALQGWQAPAPVVKLRSAALAFERAQNHLWWLTRFAEALAAVALASRARTLAARLDAISLGIFQRPPKEWIAPHVNVVMPGPRQASHAIAGGDPMGVSALRRNADGVDALAKQIEGDRLLGLRTRGIGILPTERLVAASVSGPVLHAGEHGESDVQSRILSRLRAAAADLRATAEGLAVVEPDDSSSGRWEAPAGDVRVAVEGPRGRLGLRLVSTGGDRPSQVEWQRPSAAVLSLIPEVLAGQKLADAEVIVGSLDLAMAEADG